MLSERGRRALLGIIENIEAAQDFTTDLSFEEFEGNRLRLYGVTRCLEIISEASRRVDEETRTRNAHIPWRQIADSGNVYRHRYERVSARPLWGTVHEPLPGLLVVCQNELRVGE